jgi:hypothetical protein
LENPLLFCAVLFQSIKIVTLNLIQNLFDAIEQNETIAKCYEGFTSPWGGCHEVTGEGKSV